MSAAQIFQMSNTVTDRTCQMHQKSTVANCPARQYHRRAICQHVKHVVQRIKGPRLTAFIFHSHNTTRIQIDSSTFKLPLRKWTNSHLLTPPSPITCLTTLLKSPYSRTSTIIQATIPIIASSLEYDHPVCASQQQQHFERLNGFLHSRP